VADGALTYGQSIKGQLARHALYLALVLAAHHWWLGLKPLILWTVVGVLAVTAFVPPRFSGLASGTGFLVIAGVAYFGYGQTLVAAVCGVCGVMALWEGVGSFRRV
jgi:hypothetical protein